VFKIIMCMGCCISFSCCNGKLKQKVWYADRKQNLKRFTMVMIDDLKQLHSMHKFVKVV